MKQLFVYGTLRKGFHNHSLIASAEFLQEDSLPGTLYTSQPSGKGIPFLTPGTGTVRGELYEVPDELWHLLDSLEGHPRWYTRTTRRLDSGMRAEVYMYNHEVEDLYLNSSGTYGGAVR